MQRSFMAHAKGRAGRCGATPVDHAGGWGVRVGMTAKRAFYEP
jgi:hypothetical protein